MADGGAFAGAKALLVYPSGFTASLMARATPTYELGGREPTPPEPDGSNSRSKFKGAVRDLKRP